MAETRNTFNKNKFESEFPSKLRELCDSAEKVKDLAKFLGCSIQAINQYKQGLAYPKIENLIKISQKYNCSLDYLIRLSDVQSPNAEIQAICQYTGLSEKAVKLLHNLEISNFDEEKRTILLLNTVLSDPDYHPTDCLFSDMDQFIKSRDVKRNVPNDEIPNKTVEEYYTKESLRDFEEKTVSIKSSEDMTEVLEISDLYKEHKWQQIRKKMEKYYDDYRVNGQEE